MSITITLSQPDQKRFEEIKKMVNLLGAKESSFLRVELLFYEALTIARKYGNATETNTFLKQLEKVHANEYEKTREYTQKSSQREQHIRRFNTQFKKALSSN